MIDMARWLVGDITQVKAELSVCVNRMGADGGPLNPANDAALLLVEFANGACGVIQASAVAHGADQFMHQQIRLYGEAGSLEVNVPYGGPDAGATNRAARSSEEVFQTLAVPESYWGEVSRTHPFGVFTKLPAGGRLFVEAILENRPVTPSFYDGYKAQQIVDAALESHRSGRPVTIVNPTSG